MYYTQEQIDRANQADLVSFLQGRGEQLTRAGQEYRWKRHDSLTVRGNKWYRHSQSKGGAPIDFVMEFFGKSFTEAVELLTGEKGAAPPPDRPSPAPLSDFRLPPRSTDNRIARNYLTAARRIDEDVTGFFFSTGDIYEEAAHHNAVFVGRDESGIPRYAHQRGTAGAYSQKGKISNLKEMNETFNYLRKNGIYSLEDLESRVSEHSAATESLKKTLDEQTARMKAIKQLYDSSAAFQSLKPVYDGLQKIKFEKPRAKYKAEHEAELIQFYAARRKLTGEFPDGKVDMKKLSDEYDELEQAHETTYGEFKAVRDDLHRLWKVKSCVDTAARFNERTEEQKLQNRPQTRQKKEELSR